MSIIIDLLLLAIVIFFLFSGARRGFVRTLLSFGSRIASFMIAFFVSDEYDELIYEKFFKESVINNIDEKISSTAVGDISQRISDALNAVPESFLSFVKNLGVDFSGLGEVAADSAAEGELSSFIEQTLAGPVTVMVCRIIIFAVAYALLSFAFSILINVVCRIVKLPVLRTANKALGGVLGLLNGLISALVLSYILVIISVFLDSPEFCEVVNTSYVIETLTSIMNGFIGV